MRLRTTLIACAAAVPLLSACGGGADRAAPVPTGPEASAASTAAEGARGESVPVALPESEHRHALVQLADGSLLLGLHEGAYAAPGATGPWTQVASGDAMNIAVAADGATWIGGHDVLLVREAATGPWREPGAEGLPGRDVHALAVDPDDPRHLLVAIPDEGLFESRDRGATFVQVASDGPSPAHAYGLLLGTRSEVWSADLEQGLMRSTDGGRSWTVVLDSPVAQVVRDRARPGRMLAVGERLARSTDAGKTWEALPSPGGAIAVPPATTPHAPLLMVTADGILASSDGGTTWQPAS